jgi:hypothetical protein
MDDTNDTPMPDVHDIDITIPTPPASSVAPSHHPCPLPQPRKTPLKPGGVKESELINYLDHNITTIKHRWAKRMFKDDEGGPAMHAANNEKGYRTFKQAAKDLDGLVDVVWVSGSRTPCPPSAQTERQI